MGAGQSSTAGASGAAAPTSDVKTSYYTLLSCERNATEDELKKAYRRKALELHPDRNYGNVESATTLFAEVQTAYEVLSDPQERAWYDSHEAAILRGDDGANDGDGEGAQYEYNTRVTSADDLARLMSKFNKNVEFSDAPSGFYGHLREIFEQLAKEEEIAGQWENVDVPEYPSFGHSRDEYDDVVKHFYQEWMSFSTKKTFAWKDRFRLSEAPDRQYRRAMEKENKKFREEGVKEFNDAVRTLVAFVRKRDPRYTPNTQTEEQRQKMLRDKAAAQAARARAANAKLMEQEVPAWAMKVEKDENEGIIDDSESEEEHYECVACRKTFKSEQQWDAHEKSKKHQKAVYALRKKMQKDNAALNLDSASGSGINTPLSAGDGEGDSEEVEEEDDHIPIEADSDAEITEQIHHMTLQQDSQDDSEEDSQDESHDEHDNPDEDEEGYSPEEDVHSPRTTAAPQLDSEPNSNSTSDEDSESDSNDEYASPGVVKSRIASALASFSAPETPTTNSTSKAKSKAAPDSNTESLPTIAAPATSPLNPTNATSDAEDDDDDDDWDTKPKGGKKQGAAAKKRAKKAAAAAKATVAEQTNVGSGAGAGAGAVANGEFACQVCGAGFASKTRMFQHIKDEGHAALKGTGGGGGGGGKKKKGKK